MAVTQKDIAQRLGLSRSTVGAVLENRPTVWASPATRRRITEAAREMNYRPHSAARSLSTGKTYAVAIFWLAPHEPSLTALALRICSAGYTVTLRPQATQTEALASLRDAVHGSECDVFIICVSDSRAAQEQGELLQSLGAPFVIMARFDDSHPEWHQVDFDHEAMMAGSVRELANRGHRRIYYVGYDSDATFAERLRAGYLAAMRTRFDADVPGDWLAGVDAGPQMPESILRQWLTRPLAERPTAAIIGANQVAWLGFEKALATLGRRIGYGADEFALVGIAQGTSPLMYGHALAYQIADGRATAEAAASVAIALADKRLPEPVRVQRILPELSAMWCFDMPFTTFVQPQAEQGDS